MKRSTHSHWIAGVLIVAAGTSLAEVRSSVQLPNTPGAEERAAAAPECRRYLELPADSTSELVPWDNQLSLAGCRPLMVPAPVSDPAKLPALVASLDDSAAPSIAIYRDAIARAPDSIKIAAAYELGMTYVDLMVRARNALRATDNVAMYGGTTYGHARNLDRGHALHGDLEPLLVGDRNAALAAFEDVARLAAQNPAAANSSDVDRFAVTDAQRVAATVR